MTVINRAAEPGFPFVVVSCRLFFCKCAGVFLRQPLHTNKKNQPAFQQATTSIPAAVQQLNNHPGDFESLWE